MDTDENKVEKTRLNNIKKCIIYMLEIAEFEILYITSDIEFSVAVDKDLNFDHLNI